MTKAVLQLRIRFEPDVGPEYMQEMALDREAVTACVQAAAGRPTPTFAYALEHAHRWLQEGLRTWAAKAMPERVAKASETDQFAAMLMANLRRAEAEDRAALVRARKDGAE